MREPTAVVGLHQYFVALQKTSSSPWPLASPLLMLINVFLQSHQLRCSALLRKAERSLLRAIAASLTFNAAFRWLQRGLFSKFG